jgi:hypothetical protein
MAAASQARKVISILPFIQKAGVIFDDHATEAMGKAFDDARQALHDKGQPAIVYEVIASRIVDAARKGGAQSKPVAQGWVSRVRHGLTGKIGKKETASAHRFGDRARSGVRG